jgi:3-methyladenine DNA glycosylase AlkD
MDAAAAIAREIESLARRDTPSIRAVRRRWSKTLRAAPAVEVLAIATAVEAQAGQGGKWVAYELIRFHSKAFAEVGQDQIAGFANRAASWYAVDALGTILTGALWARGRLSDGLIADWARSDNLWLRRSALVATVGLNAALRGFGDAVRTLAICRALSADHEDMVEKAMSWALRELSKRDRPAVERFMAELEASLASRVRREVRHKLSTGLKTPRKGGKATAD